MKTPHFIFIACCICLACSTRAQPNAQLRLKGTVVDPGGKPVDGAIVESYSLPRDPFSAGPELAPGKPVVATNGVFELALTPNRWTIIVRKEGFAPAWRTFFNVVSEAELRLTLCEPGTLSGEVVDETEKPVANAEVFVELAMMMTDSEAGSRSVGYLVGNPARKLFNTRTSSDGRFAIQGFPTNASAELTVQAAGKALRREAKDSPGLSDLPWRAGDDPIRLIVEPAGAVEGRIVAGESGQLPPVATIRLAPDRGNLFGAGLTQEIQSRDDGSFLVPNIPAGGYRLRAWFGTNAFPEWIAELVPVSVETGQTNKGVEVKALRGGVVEVAVLERKERKPLPGVNVSAFSQGYPATAVSDSKGIAWLRLPPGDYQVSAALDGGRPESSSVTAEDGKTNRVEMELGAPSRIQGIVRGPDGQPAAGVEVRIVGGPMASRSVLKSDSEGKFEAPITIQSSMQGAPCLLLRDPQRNLAYAEDVDEDSAPLDVKLGPAITLAGRAECDGVPVTNATAALIFWTGRSGMHLAGIAVGTNIPGRFEIPALPPGRRYGVMVSAPGFGQKSMHTIPSDGEGRIELDPIELLPANLKLAGQVVDQDDKPVPGANVYMSGEGQPSGNATTDRQGRFAFNNACEGSVRLMGNARNMHGNVSAQGGDTNVVLKLGASSAVYSSASSKTSRLKGIVTDPDGRPLPGAQVTVFPAEGSSVKTATDGAFSLSWTLQPWQMQQGGDPWLVVRDLSRNLAAAETISDGTTNLNVQVKPALTVVGQVQKPDGSALVKAEIELLLMAGRSYNQLQQQPIRTDAEGKFEVNALPPGPKYLIYASAKEYGRSRQEFGEDPGTNRLELPPFSLKPADQILEGQVLNEQEKPASGLQVTLNGDDQPSGSVVTDKQGRFRFKVCEGNVQLYAHANNGYANARASAGDTNVVLQIRGYSGITRSEPARISLKGKPLPDLAEFGLASDTRAAGKPLLLCLVDAEQRPSRRSARVLSEQHEALCQKGIAVVAVQAVPVSVETIQSWTNSAPLPFPLGCLKEKSARTKWVTDVQSLPWLILCDSKGNVTDEGFSVDDLPVKLSALK